MKSNPQEKQNQSSVAHLPSCNLKLLPLSHINWAILFPHNSSYHTIPIRRAAVNLWSNNTSPSWGADGAGQHAHASQTFPWEKQCKNRTNHQPRLQILIYNEDKCQTLKVKILSGDSCWSKTCVAFNRVAFKDHTFQDCHFPLLPNRLFL